MRPRNPYEVRKQQREEVEKAGLTSKERRLATTRGRGREKEELEGSTLKILGEEDV